MHSRAVAFTAFLIAFGAVTASADGPLVPGARAPHFVGRTVTGEALNLASTRGRVTLLNFILTNYREEASHLRAIEGLRTRLGRRGLAVLTVALDQEPSEPVAAFVRRCGVQHPVFLDPGRKIADKFGVQAAPTLYVLDPWGVVVRYQEGYMAGDEKALAATIETLIDRELGPGDHRDEGTCHCYAPRP